MANHPGSVTIAVFVFVNASQPVLLQRVAGTGADAAGSGGGAGQNATETRGARHRSGATDAAENGHAGELSGTILVVGELTSLLVGAVSGVASDGIGRRMVYSIGLCVCALGCVACVASRTFVQLLLARCLFSVGTGCTATMMTPVLAEFVHRDDKGRAAGLLGMASGLGAVCGGLVLMRVPRVAQQLSGGSLGEVAAVECGYYTTALLALGGGALAALVLPGPAESEAARATRCAPPDPAPARRGSQTELQAVCMSADKLSGPCDRARDGLEAGRLLDGGGGWRAEAGSRAGCRGCRCDRCR